VAGIAVSKPGRKIAERSKDDPVVDEITTDTDRADGSSVSCGSVESETTGALTA
jgi:hypothetical protein